MNRSLITLLSIVTLVYSAPAYVHHSGAMYDQTRTVEIAGAITEFKWSNPHATFRVDVTDESGKATNWAIVMGSPNNLVRQGWKRTTLKSGDRVTVTLFPLRDGGPGGYYVSIVLADGTRLDGDPPEGGK
ncbi:MAG: hypothetical protein EPO31_10900 [Gammaproteobacteria bacterium]|jgi:hypothetical protein|nr:MAG: hypothetical protein EPO31_10900 [Gammaproteobacteria bacterium]